LARSRARPVRVAIASRLFAPEVAAASFRLNALAGALASSGAEVRVLTTTPPASSARSTAAPNIMVSRFPVLRDRSGSVRGYLQYLSFDAPLFFRLLFTRADVVIAEPPPTTGIVVAVTSWLRRRPFVYYAADIWAEAAASTGAPDVVVRLLRRAESTVLRGSATVLAVSEAVAAKARALGAREVVSVGNGVDTTVFAPDGTSTTDPAPYFVYTGTMSEWQGAEVFLEALGTVLAVSPGARLHFFGSGSRLPALREIAEQLESDVVRFHGTVTPEETAEWLRAATASLVSIRPGQGYDFAKPTKLYAAAACGTPILFAGTGAGRDLVESAGLGLAVDHKKDAVAAAMLNLIDAQASGASARLRRERARWAQKHASLGAVGARAATAVLSVDFRRKEARSR
jgi:glycosyltransferase involved in cell wall biosynthesis